MAGWIGTFFDLVLVILGFSLIVFFHELGHFVAAKWAGIRVLAFAIGFGPAACTYRRGLGWRRGSSEREYRKRLNAGTGGATTVAGRRSTYRELSPTEYRLNWLPFGGYVKMLGQDDIDPTAVSDAPDSYQSCPPGKRMVVLSAGVIANIAISILLFIVVFMIGLDIEPPRIGQTVPGQPAAAAVALNAEQLGVTGPGLQPGDEVVSLNGRKPHSFNDLALASAMAGPDKPVRMTVRRAGVNEPLIFRITPEKNPLTDLLDIGIEPARSATLLGARNASDAEAFRRMLEPFGLGHLEPGMTLVEADGEPIGNAHDLVEAVRASGGEPIRVRFESDNNQAEASLVPQPELQAALTKVGASDTTLTHLLGLTPVMKVGELTERDRAFKQGLRQGDVFVRLGAVEYPSIPQGIAEIRAHKGRAIKTVVLRQGQLVELDPRVSYKGQIGFLPDDTSADSTLVAKPPATLRSARAPDQPYRPAAVDLITSPGTRILRIDGSPVSDFADIRAALLEASRDRLPDGSATVSVAIELPYDPAGDGRHPVQESVWRLSSSDVEALHELAWTSPLEPWLFQPELVTLRAKGPIDAVRMGVLETNRVMLTVYVTFARLIQGTVKVEHLKGPVGIAHIGTRIADRGLLWILFFMALISANLAVVNFLPIPIVDGGQFLLVVVEAVRGKPVPLAIQNAATVAGLVLIGSVFLIVTFNDLMALFGG